MKTARLFLYSSGTILVITGAAKIWSALGKARLLGQPDPILNLSFRNLMITAGILELIIAGVCFFSKSRMVSSAIIAWLGTSFLAYRLGLYWSNWHRPCPCMGTVTDALHISPQTADTIMKVVLAYLLIGSYTSLFLLWRKRVQSQQAPDLPKSSALAS